MFIDSDSDSGCSPISCASALSLKKHGAISPWVTAALRAETGDCDWDAFVLPCGDPNDALISKTLKRIGDAHFADPPVTARAFGVVRATCLDSPPPRNWNNDSTFVIKHHIDGIRASRHSLGPLPNKAWAKSLPGHVAATKASHKTAMERSLADGTAFAAGHHDFCIEPDQLQNMCQLGWLADSRVHAKHLAALEAGLATATLMQTGNRGGEIPRVPLQSLKHCPIPHASSGEIFDVLKITCFINKTGLQHSNMLLAAADPLQCPIGQLGLAILVRRSLHGPPPFTMPLTSTSWLYLGSTTPLPARLKTLMACAGVRRAPGDPVTNIGRHLGTRLLAHNGATEPEIKARTGHGHDGTACKCGCPIPACSSEPLFTC